MSVAYRVGLLGDGRLTKAELETVLKAMSAEGVTERIDGAFFDFWLDENGTLTQVPSDPEIEPLQKKLFDARGGSVSDHAASEAELCVLIPGDVDPKFQIARGIDGVRGWRFKSLTSALGELQGYSEESGDDCGGALRILRQADNLRVGVIFGERGA